MANTIKIAGDIRDEFGKGAARRMRVAKLIPATLYAGGDQPTFVKLPMKETTLALRHTNAAVLDLLRWPDQAGRRQGCAAQPRQAHR